MIKRLLTIALLACSASSFAQMIDKNEPLMNAPSFDVSDEVAIANEPEDFSLIQKQPKSSYNFGLYYSRPAGTLYRSWNEEGSGQGPIYLYTPPFQDIVFTPHVADITTPVSWEFRYITTDSTRVVDVNEYVDPVTGNLVYPGLRPGYYIAAPTMIQGDSTFTIGEKSSYWATKNKTYFTRVSPTTDILPMSFFDDHTNVKNIVGWGTLDAHYLFGSGTYKDSCQATGAYQVFEAPAGPLYVEKVFMKYVSFSQTPIPEGKQIKMYVYNPTTKDNYAILYAKPEDVVQKKSSSSTYGVYYTGYVTFYKRVEDEFGNEGTEPFVIDGELAVQVDDLAQEGVSIGFNGVLNPDEDTMTPARQLVRYPDGSTKSFTYKTPYSMGVFFYGLFDGINVDTENDANKLTVAADGTVADSALVYHTTKWADVDEDGNVYEEYYYFDEEELPEWVISYGAATTAESSYISRLGFECEPLPAGVEGRQAKLYLKGRGVIADTPIILTQGVVSETVPGDSDLDGSVTVADITTTAAYILGKNPNPFCFENADVDGDKVITVADITGTAGIILGK